MSRSSKKIVRQTNEIAREILRTMHRMEVPSNVELQKSVTPRAQQAWQLACRAQEIITGIDVSNAVSELENKK